jgi:hypothetical protein
MAAAVWAAAAAVGMGGLCEGVAAALAAAAVQAETATSRARTAMSQQQEATEEVAVAVGAGPPPRLATAARHLGLASLLLVAAVAATSSE